jgi:hypothetical protein
VPDRVCQVVKVRGAVTSFDLRGGNGIEYYIQDATGGIDLFSTALNAGLFAIGDNVEAIGTVTQFNGLTELTVTSVTPSTSLPRLSTWRMDRCRLHARRHPGPRSRSGRRGLRAAAPMRKATGQTAASR